jgi:hypothetical protein
MPTLRPLLTDFSAGELSPRLAGRVDLPVYFKGAQEITNFRVQTLGGVTKRPGTSLLAGTVSDAKARLIPWAINDSTVLLLELTATAVAGEGRLSIFYNGVLATLPGPAALLLTTPYLVSELAAIQYAQSYREIYLVHPAHPPVFLRFVSGTASTMVLEYDVEDTTFSANLIVWPAPTTTPYTSYDFWAKIGTWLMPRKSYTATGTFAGKTVSAIERRDDFVVVTLGTGTYSNVHVVSGNTTLHGFTGLTTNELAGIQVSGTNIPVGAYIVSNTDTTALLSVAPTGSSDTTTLTRGDLWIVKGSSYVHQGSISVDLRPFLGANNYPSAVAYFAGRLWMGRSVNDPSTFWGSKVNDLKNFCVFEEVVYDVETKTDIGTITIGGADGAPGTTVAGDKTVTGFSGLSVDALIGKYVTGLNIAYGTKVTDNDATTVELSMDPVAAGTCYMRFTTWKDANIAEYSTTIETTQQIGPGSAVRIKLATEEDESIKWILGKDGLQVGTSCSEWVIENAHNAVQARAVMVTRYGSANVQARMVGGAAVYVGASSHHIRQLSSEGTPPLTAQADHIIPAGETVVQLDFQQTPDVCLYAVLSGGDMLRCVIDPSLGVMAWDRIRLRGTEDVTISVADKILSVAVVPGAARDFVYIVTERTIATATKRFIELFLENTDTLHTARNYLDLSVEKSGAAFTTVAGLSHLNGQVCTYLALLATGAWSQSTVTPAAGTATIPSSTYAIVGLGYKSRLKTQRIDVPDSEGLMKQISNIFFRLYKSFGFTCSWGSLTGQSAAVVTSDTDAIYTGPQQLTVDNGANSDVELTIDSNDPVPCGIQTIVPLIDMGE